MTSNSKMVSDQEAAQPLAGCSHGGVGWSSPCVAHSAAFNRGHGRRPAVQPWQPSRNPPGGPTAAHGGFQGSGRGRDQPASDLDLTLSRLYAMMNKSPPEPT